MTYCAVSFEISRIGKVKVYNITTDNFVLSLLPGHVVAEGKNVAFKEQKSIYTPATRTRCRPLSGLLLFPVYSFSVPL